MDACDFSKFGRVDYMETQRARHADFLYGVEWQLDKANKDRDMISDAITCLEDRVHKIETYVLPTFEDYHMTWTAGFDDASLEATSKRQQLEQLRSSLHDTECELRKLRIEARVARAKVAAFDAELVGL